MPDESGADAGGDVEFVARRLVRGRVLAMDLDPPLQIARGELALGARTGVPADVDADAADAVVLGPQHEHLAVAAAKVDDTRVLAQVEHVAQRNELLARDGVDYLQIA